MMLRSLLFMLLIAIPLTGADLEQVFEDPPRSAKPRGYWVWPHGNFDYVTIKEELQAFQAKGLGGVDIFDLGVKDRADVIPAGPAFMSPEQVDGIAFALDEGQRLGLKIGLIVSSSWNAGGSWTPPEHAAMNLVASIDTVQGPMTYDKTLPLPTLPDTFSKRYGTFPLHVPRDENGQPKYALDVATLVLPLSEDKVLADPAQVRVLKGPEVNIDLPAGRWMILRTVCANFGQRLWVPSKNSNGLSIDHFSKAAVGHHFNTIIDRLEKRCGPLAHTALDRLYLASYEANAVITWTPTFPQEFYERNGYRIEAYMPALFGVTVQNEEVTERFLYDFRKTISDVFVANLYSHARDICHKHGLKLCSESGGPGAPLHDVPTEDLKALGAVDVMRGEFWVDKKERLNPDGSEELQIVKSIASAAHIYGHPVVEMEAFTSHTNWQEGPATFKPLADRAFCEGMTRVVYHTMSHNVPEAGQPGWSYSAGTHMSTNLTWWPLSDQLHAYLARCSALLQQGHFVADVCFYYGHEIPNFAKPKHVRPSLGPGYDYDDINTEVLLTAQVRQGRVVLPSGMSYALLVLPDDERMDLAVLRRIKELLYNGATIVGPRPLRVYGLADYQKQERELKALADELWGQGRPTVLDRRVGQGRLIVGKGLRQILSDMDIGPDVEVLNAPTQSSLDFIHRRTEDADIYFLRNSESKPLTVDLRCRVQGRQPQLWDAVTGTRQVCSVFVQEEEGTRLPLHLDPHGSIFLIFKGAAHAPHITRVDHQGKQCFPLMEKTEPVAIKATQEKDGIRFQAQAPGTYHVELSDGSQKSLQVQDTAEFQVTGAWDLRFPSGWGVKTVQRFASLHSWTEAEDPDTRSFSGIATYRKAVQVPPAFVQGDQAVGLDLGTVREIAQVFLNGQELGISSFAPHRFDVTGVIRTGDNYLVVKVANTWLNRLNADDRLPADARRTHTNLTRGPTGSTAWRDATPLPSGLLGPVRLIAQECNVITNR